MTNAEYIKQRLYQCNYKRPRDCNDGGEYFPDESKDGPE